MKSHRGTMESLKGKALTKGEKGLRSLPSAHHDQEAQGHIGREPHKHASHRENADRFSKTGHGGTKPQEFHSGAHEGGGFHGHFEHRGISQARKEPEKDTGPRKGSSIERNRSGKNASGGRLVRSGISRRTPDIID